MNFFNFDDETRKLTVTPSIWIYVLSSVVLTILTFSIYYLVIQNDGPIVKRMTPKISVEGLGVLARRSFSIKAGSKGKIEGVTG